MVDILSRDEWGASVALGSPMRLPAVGVHVHHSVTVPSFGDVAADMRTIERIGAQRFGRFSYSWCGHPSGVVGEGAGTSVGAHTAGWNSTTFGYCLIGNYEHDQVTDAQVQAFLEWRAWAVAVGWLVPDHWVEPHRARKATACPGANTMARWVELAGGIVVPPPAGPTPDPGPGGLLRRGSRGQAVADWQTILAGAGLDVGPIDGIFGPKTEAATREFQAKIGVTVDGIVGPETRTATERILAWLAAVAGQPTPAAPPFPGTVRRGSRGPTVRVVQARLAERGWRITVDGIFGPQTDDVVRRFQADKGLRVDGIVGPVTWDALWTAPIT